MGQGNTGGISIIQLVGGIYLSYTGFNLAKGYLSGGTSNVMFLIAGGIFLFIGVFFLINSARAYFNRQKEGEEELETIEEDGETEVIESDSEADLSVDIDSDSEE
jgi:hypothetical protein